LRGRRSDKTEKDKTCKFFRRDKIFHGNLPEARGLKELDHKQYELERFDHYINNA
jgi:hypothetical protein